MPGRNSASGERPTRPSTPFVRAVADRRAAAVELASWSRSGSSSATGTRSTTILASLQSVHYEDCIEVNYQLDSTANPGKLIAQGAGADAEGKERRRGPLGTRVLRGADFQEREVYDMMAFRFAGHPELKRILMWDGRRLPAPQGLPRAVLRGPTKVFDIALARRRAHGRGHFPWEDDQYPPSTL